MERLTSMAGILNQVLSPGSQTYAVRPTHAYIICGTNRTQFERTIILRHHPNSTATRAFTPHPQLSALQPITSLQTLYPTEEAGQVARNKHKSNKTEATRQFPNFL